jgi:hypothetical protein
MTNQKIVLEEIKVPRQVKPENINANNEFKNSKLYFRPAAKVWPKLTRLINFHNAPPFRPKIAGPGRNRFHWPGQGFA